MDGWRFDQEFGSQADCQRRVAERVGEERLELGSGRLVAEPWGEAAERADCPCHGMRAEDERPRQRGERGEDDDHHGVVERPTRAEERSATTTSQSVTIAAVRCGTRSGAVMPRGLCLLGSNERGDVHLTIVTGRQTYALCERRARTLWRSAERGRR